MYIIQKSQEIKFVVVIAPKCNILRDKLNHFKNISAPKKAYNKGSDV